MKTHRYRLYTYSYRIYVEGEEYWVSYPKVLHRERGPACRVGPIELYYRHGELCHIDVPSYMDGFGDHKTYDGFIRSVLGW